MKTEDINYSVIIRTTGNAHEKYQKLLDSISQLKPIPAEVIVVLPENYDLPVERLGWETFVFCAKGMVRQRLVGVEAAKTRYALICDDDVSFPSDFVKKLHEPISEGKASFSVAPLYSFLPEKGLESLICTLMASAVPTVFHRKTRYVSVLKSSGYSYNKHLDRKTSRFYESQSAAWTCFYADISAFKKIEFDKEDWIDAHGYSALDDQTMFYKAWLMGFKTIVVSDAEYSHLDAKTSQHNNNYSMRFSMSHNRLIFWHRFIYLQQKGFLGKLVSVIAFLYRLIWIEIWKLVSIIRRRISIKDCSISREGFKQAMLYLKSYEYRQLPPIIKG